MPASLGAGAGRGLVADQTAAGRRLRRISPPAGARAARSFLDVQPVFHRVHGDLPRLVRLSFFSTFCTWILTVLSLTSSSRA